VRWQDLKDLFRKAGTVLRADVSLGPDNRSRGYGTVLLATAEDAGRAIDMFNGYTWQTRILEVRHDRSPPDLDGSASNVSSASISMGLPGSGNASPLPMGVSQSMPLPFGGSTMTGTDATIAANGLLGIGLNPLAKELNPGGVDYNALLAAGLERPHSTGTSGRNLFVGNVRFYWFSFISWISPDNPSSFPSIANGKTSRISSVKQAPYCVQMLLWAQTDAHGDSGPLYSRQIMTLIEH
jgi:RNA recognition motif-containing protein